MAPIKIKMLPISPSCLPPQMLCIENGIEYEMVMTDLMKGEQMAPDFVAQNPMHTVPVMDDDGFAIWEGRTITRYIANKHKLDSWYPADPKKRALCDLGLDFQLATVYPNVAMNVLYPAAGFGAPKTPEEVKAAGEKWDKDIWPAFKKLIEHSGGPLLGGAKPNLADLSMILVVVTVAKCPDSYVAKTAECVAYCKALKAALPKWDEYMGPAEGFYGKLE